MAKNQGVSVILPVYNEEANLERLVKKIDSTFRKNKIKGEAVFIDDGSTDNSNKILKELKKKYKFIRIVNHGRNKGLAQVFITAFGVVKGNEIVFLPSDLQSDPEEDIPKLLNKLNEGYDVVCGVREEWNRPKTKVIQSKIYSYLSRKIFKIKVSDFNWIRAFKKEVAEDISFLRKDWHRYFVVLAAKKGYKIGEVKVTEYSRASGKSKFNVSRVFTGFLDMFVVKFYLEFREKPMLLFSIPGALSLIISIILGGYLFFDWLRGVEHFQLYLVDLILFIAGIQLFAMGFIAELIATIKEELSNKK